MVFSPHGDAIHVLLLRLLLLFALDWHDFLMCFVMFFFFSVCNHLLNTGPFGPQALGPVADFFSWVGFSHPGGAPIMAAGNSARF